MPLFQFGNTQGALDYQQAMAKAQQEAQQWRTIGELPRATMESMLKMRDQQERWEYLQNQKEYMDTLRSRNETLAEREDEAYSWQSQAQNYERAFVHPDTGQTDWGKALTDARGLVRTGEMSPGVMDALRARRALETQQRFTYLEGESKARAAHLAMTSAELQAIVGDANAESRYAKALPGVNTLLKQVREEPLPGVYDEDLVKYQIRRGHTLQQQATAGGELAKRLLNNEGQWSLETLPDMQNVLEVGATFMASRTAGDLEGFGRDEQTFRDQFSPGLNLYFENVGILPMKGESDEAIANRNAYMRDLEDVDDLGLWDQRKSRINEMLNIFNPSGSRGGSGGGGDWSSNPKTRAYQQAVAVYRLANGLGRDDVIPAADLAHIQHSTDEVFEPTTGANRLTHGQAETVRGDVSKNYWEIENVLFDKDSAKGSQLDSSQLVPDIPRVLELLENTEGLDPQLVNDLGKALNSLHASKEEINQEVTVDELNDLMNGVFSVYDDDNRAKALLPSKQEEADLLWAVYQFMDSQGVPNEETGELEDMDWENVTIHDMAMWLKDEENVQALRNMEGLGQTFLHKPHQVDWTRWVEQLDREAEEWDSGWKEHNFLTPPSSVDAMMGQRVNPEVGSSSDFTNQPTITPAPVESGAPAPGWITRPTDDPMADSFPADTYASTVGELRDGTVPRPSAGEIWEDTKVYAEEELREFLHEIPGNVIDTIVASEDVMMRMIRLGLRTTADIDDWIRSFRPFAGHSQEDLRRIVERMEDVRRRTKAGESNPRPR
jgi:hypothetical protein